MMTGQTLVIDGGVVVTGKEMTTNVDWIAVDWGTTNLRAWVFDSAGQIVATLTSDRGMGGLECDAFEPALLALIAPYLADGQRTPVIACGMVGARQGWTEATYADVPCPPPAIDRATRAPANDPRIEVFILPGVSQNRPADVMRGEETQIGGFLASNPNFDGTLCLPGTHTKWVQISAGEIISFRTFMTGDLFAAIMGHTVLRHSAAKGQDLASFDCGVSEGLSRPEMLTARLFTLRAEGLLHHMTAVAASERLSGLLIGQELAGAKQYWLSTQVALIGGAALCERYARSLSTLGAKPELADGDTMVLAGLRAAQARLKTIGT